MAFDLTQQTIAKAAATSKTPQVIVEIEGIPTTYTAVGIKKVPKVGEDYTVGQVDFFVGIPITDENAREYIDLRRSTNQITQQLNQDKGGSGSISSFNVSIIDKENYVSNEFSTQEMLSKRAKIYLSFAELEHPINSIKIFSGIISKFDTMNGEIKLTVDNPDTLKDQEIFVQITDLLTSAIDSSQTTISIDNSTGILLPSVKLSAVTPTGFTTYIRIDDEIIEVGGISGNDLTGCTRAQLGTIASAHDDEAEISTNYRLQGNPLELALQVMMSSRTDAHFLNEVSTIAFNSFGSTVAANSVWFDTYSAQEEYGLVVGDRLDITGSTSNDRSNDTITAFGQAEGVSYVVLSSTVNSEGVASGTEIAFTSQYSTMPDGCSMGGEDVDVDQHLFIKETYGQSFPDMDFLLKEGITGKTLIEQEIYYPIAAYYLPRKGKASVGYTAPAVGNSAPIEIGQDNVTNALQIKTMRSIKKNFYNAVIYKIEEDILEDKFKRIINTLSEDSQNRIKKGITPYTIEAKGLRRDISTESFVENASVRILDRYRYAAVSFNVEVSYGVGFSLEVGDTVIFNGEGLGIYNYESGSRADFYKSMEVTNKSLNISSGKIKLQLTDTAYDTDGRYATFTASSLIAAGSTTTELKLKRSFGTTSNESETTKWSPFVKNNVLVRSKDWTFSEVVEMSALTSAGGDIMTVSPALSVSPSEDYIIEVPNYDDSASNYKSGYAFTGLAEVVASGTSGTVFTVTDGTEFFVDGIVQVNNSDFTNFATSVIVDVSGNIITVETDLGFTPSSGDLVTRVGFESDEGKSYLYL